RGRQGRRARAPRRTAAARDLAPRRERPRGLRGRTEGGRRGDPDPRRGGRPVESRGRDRAALRAHAGRIPARRPLQRVFRPGAARRSTRAGRLRSVLGSFARHVKWFTDPSLHPTDYSLLLTLPVIAAFGIAAIATAVAAFVQRRVPEPRIFRALERFAWLGPLVLGVHLGIALIVAAILGMLFVPSLRVEPDAFGFALLVAEAACGVLLLLGFATRGAALALAMLGVVAMAPFNFESILEQVHILGAAIFLFIIGRR